MNKPNLNETWKTGLYWWTFIEVTPFHLDSKTYNYLKLDFFICKKTFSLVNSINLIYCQLRARRALSLLHDVPLRTRRALSLCKVYGDSALLVLNGTLLNSVNALLAFSRRYIHVCSEDMIFPQTSAKTQPSMINLKHNCSCGSFCPAVLTLNYLLFPKLVIDQICVHKNHNMLIGAMDCNSNNSKWSYWLLDM